MIYYSHVNEDNRAELDLLELAEFANIICVAGSGERVTALLDYPKLRNLQVVDHNLDALYLTQLKLTALRHLEVSEYLAFVGFQPAGDAQRMAWYQSLATGLTDHCRVFWDARLPLIESGVAYAGHFERFLARIRPLVNVFLGSGMLSAIAGDYTNFPTLRWKLLKLSFSQRWVYRLFGNRDEAFVGDQTHVSLIPDGIQQLIDNRQLGESFMAHLIFRGDLRQMKVHDLPPSLQPDSLARIRERLRAKTLTVRYVHDDLATLLTRSELVGPEQSLFISLSDIVSFAPGKYFFDCLDILEQRRSGPHALTFRAFLKNRLAASDLNLLETKGYRCRDWSERDLTHMYQIYAIDKL